MKIPNKYKDKERINKLFLLVFHGGLLCYLFLHNFLLPLVRNIGQGKPLLNELHYYFIPHGMLFLSFFFAKFSKKEKNTVPLFVALNLTILIFSIVFFMFDINDGLTVEEFTDLISLISMSCFFLGLFIYFKKFFLWNISLMKYQYLIGISLGIIFIFFHERISSQKKIITTIPTSIQQNDITEIKINLPSSKFSKNEIAILKSGFKNTHGLFPLNTKIKLINHTNKKHLLRLEYIKNKKWYFKKIISLDKKNQNIINIKEKNIYRLRSPSSKLGYFILIIGSDIYDKGIYILDKKGLRFSNA